jgi:hypothetical protein
MDGSNGLRCRAAGALGAWAIGFLSMLGATASLAHHSPAGFDTSRSITITGVVTKYEWFNPHVYITLDETQQDGKKIEWEIESFAPAMMARIGFTKQSLRVGDVLTVTGAPARNPNAKALLGGTIKRADSTLLNTAMFAKQFAPATDAPKFAAKTLEGTWLTQPTVQAITQNAFPDVKQMTAFGADVFKRFDEKTMSPASNCLPQPSPTSMVMPDMKRIAINQDTLVIELELDGGKRAIHLNSTHEGAIPSHQGHSIGRWQGKTLVIETTLFAYHALGNGIGLPSGRDKKLVERLVPSADGTTLTYHYEMHDSQYLLAPRVGQVTWSYRPDLAFASEPCSLESARRFINH